MSGDITLSNATVIEGPIDKNSHVELLVRSPSDTVTKCIIQEPLTTFFQQNSVVVGTVLHIKGYILGTPINPLLHENDHLVVVCIEIEISSPSIVHNSCVMMLPTAYPRTNTVDTVDTQVTVNKEDVDMEDNYLRKRKRPRRECDYSPGFVPCVDDDPDNYFFMFHGRLQDLKNTAPHLRPRVDELNTRLDDLMRIYREFTARRDTFIDKMHDFQTMLKECYASLGNSPMPLKGKKTLLPQSIYLSLPHQDSED